jgi:hypothetical protein
VTIELPEKEESLWALVLPPTLWALHFLLSYGTAAIWCAKLAGDGGSLFGARVAIAVYTGLALLGVFVAGYRGFRRHRFAGSPLPHDADTPDDRHRFLGFATLLLSGLSAIAIVYSALAAVFVGSCA